MVIHYYVSKNLIADIKKCLEAADAYANMLIALREIKGCSSNLFFL